MNRETNFEMSCEEVSCEEVNFILDAHPREKLGGAGERAVERHFASCRACREAWAAYRELEETPVPAPPKSLRARVEAAIAAHRTPPARHRRARGSLFIGGFLVLGAAVAATVALQRAEAPVGASKPLPAATPSGASTAGTEPGATLPTGPARIPPEQPATPPAPTVPGDAIFPAPPGAEPDEASQAASNDTAYSLDPFSLVVIAKLDPDDDSGVAGEFAKCQEAVLARLEAVAGLNVISGERVSAFASSDSPPIDIARQLGAGNVLVLQTMNHEPSCSARELDARTGSTLFGTLGFVGPDSNTDGWRSFAESVAKSVEDATFKDNSTVIAEARAAILNTSLGDEERIHALVELRQGPGLGLFALDAAIVSAAARIGSTSADPRARESAWVWLRGVRDRDLVQPLLQALAGDPDADVRRAAASSLAYFLDEPGVREALTRALAEDPAERPRVPCCVPTVREAARLALLFEEPSREAVAKIVLDETLTPHERLLLMDPDGVHMLRLSDLGERSDEAARAVFEIGSRSDDADTRSRAWSLLADAGDPEFERALLEDLAHHPADRVRAAAARGLLPYVGERDVIAALQQAQRDASLAVRRAAKATLDREPSFPLGP